MQKSARVVSKNITILNFDLVNVSFAKQCVDLYPPCKYQKSAIFLSSSEGRNIFPMFNIQKCTYLEIFFGFYSCLDIKKVLSLSCGVIKVVQVLLQWKVKFFATIAYLFPHLQMTYRLRAKFVCLSISFIMLLGNILIKVFMV